MRAEVNQCKVDYTPPPWEDAFQLWCLHDLTRCFPPTKVHKTISAGLSNIVHALKKKLSTVVERNVRLFFQTFIATLF